MTSTPALIARAASFGAKTAIVDEDGGVSYASLLDASARVASALLDGAADLAEARVAFLVPPGVAYAEAQWGVWRAGGVAVPLCPQHPPPELEYVIEDSQASIVLAHARFAESLRPIAAKRHLRFMLADARAASSAAPLPQLHPARRAMMLYTSGTTSRPKGVVTTHRNIEAQIASLVEAWEWTAEDHTLHVLPLHHIHGIINILGCALWSGATCEMMPRFDAVDVWRRFERGGVNVFMAVPTVYARLIAAWEGADAATRRRWSDACRRMRLMVSGSAALPTAVLERWRDISGHVLLERYGMTEIGMALSNPYRGPRVAGHVGGPLPGVEARLVDERGMPVPPGQPGEIQVKGPTVFLEYWGRPEATATSFADGWFRTGDVAVVEEGGYRILGRESVDIIKTGGYKVSALEIEEVVRAHPAVAECAVVGVPDVEWGERVCVAVVLRDGCSLDLANLRAWGKERLAAYKVPSRLLAVSELPRNQMGKVTKPEVARLFQSGGRT